MMIEGLRPYEDMRPSGLPGLGPLPSHWTVRKLRHCGMISGGMTPSMADPSLWDGDVPWVTPKDMKRFTISAASMNVAGKALEETSLRLILPPAVLLVVRGMILARRVPIARTVRPVTINQDMKAIAPAPGIDAGYLAYRLEAAQDAFVPLIDEAGHGTKRFPTERWRELPLGIPSLDEQRLIVRLLDWHGAQTAKFIRTKKQLVALLNEQKQAIVHRAMTRGLDQNVRRKPSGITWLGDVPEHWKVVSLTSLSTLIQTGPFGSQLPASSYTVGGVPVINPSHIGDGGITPDSDISVMEEMASKLSRHRFAPGDIVLARRGELGRCAVIREREAGWLCGTGSIKLRLRTDTISSDYCARLFGDSEIRAALKLVSIGATMDNLNEGMIGRLRLAVPPLSEQANIDKAVTQTESDFRVIIEATNREIVLLNEFRTRLIADVVTGKLDAREAAVSLPEQIDDFEQIEAADALDEFEDSASENFEPEGAAA